MPGAYQTSDFAYQGVGEFAYQTEDADGVEAFGGPPAMVVYREPDDDVVAAIMMAFLNGPGRL